MSERKLVKTRKLPSSLIWPKTLVVDRSTKASTFPTTKSASRPL